MTTPPGLERRPLLSCSTSTLLWLRVPSAWTPGGAWSVLGEGGQVRQCAMPRGSPRPGPFRVSRSAGALRRAGAALPRPPPRPPAQRDPEETEAQNAVSVLRLLRVLPHRPPPWSGGLGGAVLAALQAQRAGPGRVWFPETPPRPPRLPSLSKTGPPKKCHPPRSNWRSPALGPAAPLPAASQSRFASLLSAAPGRRPLRPRLPCPPTAARGRPGRTAARPTRRKPTCSPLKRKPCLNPTERTLSKKRSDAGCK